MATPEGYLYSREALLENLLQQKKAIKRKLAAYEAQQQDEQQKVRVHPHAAAGRHPTNRPARRQHLHVTASKRQRRLPSTHRLLSAPADAVLCSRPSRAACAQAAEQAQVESEAKLIAFDRQNHMGISSKTAAKIQEAITAEAAVMHDAKGAKAAVNIKDNEEKMKQMRVREGGGRVCGWVRGWRCVGGARTAVWGCR